MKVRARVGKSADAFRYTPPGPAETARRVRAMARKGRVTEKPVRIPIR